MDDLLLTCDFLFWLSKISVGMRTLRQCKYVICMCVYIYMYIYLRCNAGDGSGRGSDRTGAGEWLGGLLHQAMAT